MTRARVVAVLLATLAAGLVSACGPKKISTQRPGQSLVVLLPDPDSGAVGRAAVSTPTGTADLAGARASTYAAAGQPPAPVTTMSEAEVQRLFGDALSALPPPPRHFTLFFRFESDELTDESRALLPEVLQSVRSQLVPDVTIVGHTDTTGAPAANFELGQKRANSVRNLLIEAGLDASSIEVTSHGEADPLIPTADDTFEPRNRRVEVSVR